MGKHKVNKSYREINEKIKSGKVVVVTAEEIIDIVKKEGPEEAARKVDVVTTGTFAPMCSSGAFINIGQSNPLIRTSGAHFNNVPAYTGIAAIDHYIGATAICERCKPDKSLSRTSVPSATSAITSSTSNLLAAITPTLQP